MQNPADDEALFFLGKLDLNYVWLQLATIGRKTGWKEYWEARKSLDAVLKQTTRPHPRPRRARLDRLHRRYEAPARYARGCWAAATRSEGLRVVREAAVAERRAFVQAEAMFALWDMQVRESNIPEAVVTARALSEDFPDNADLAKFVARHDSRPNFTNAAVR